MPIAYNKDGEVFYYIVDINNYEKIENLTYEKIFEDIMFFHTFFMIYVKVFCC